MIDPNNITNFNLDSWGLEENILFWICAAGKNAITSAKLLDKLLTLLKYDFGNKSPFKLISSVEITKLRSVMKIIGIGCHKLKSKSMMTIAKSNLNLKECDIEDLESIPGIGPKTARCFLIHTRPNQNYAGLDVHILKFLSDMGYDVPKSTPNSRRAYKKIESYFINEAKSKSKNIAEFDLEIWKRYRKR